MAKARSAVADALKRNPKLPAVPLAETLKSLGGEFAPALCDLLLTDFYLSEIRAGRREQAAVASAQLRLPGFDHMPLTIPGTKGEPVPLLEANYTRLRAYYRTLMIGHRNRRNNDPKIKETKTLLEAMAKRTRTNKEITVREVVLIDR